MMVKTIGNPLTWTAKAILNISHIFGTATRSLGSQTTTTPETRKITQADLKAALRKGYKDFTGFRSEVLVLVVIYPIIGVCLAAVSFDMSLLPMLFPLLAGFLLLGPVAATGMYEMSRQKERGQHVDWSTAFRAFRAQRIGPVLVLGMYLLALFVGWLLCALMIYRWTLGPEAPTSLTAFASDVFTTSAGWTMIFFGMGVGFVFACIALVVSVISFPMLIDQRVGLPVAVATSVKVARENPVTIATWGLIVAVLMLFATLPLFLGLVIVLPLLGHATWHLYRAAVPDETAD